MLNTTIHFWTAMDFATVVRELQASPFPPPLFPPLPRQKRIPKCLVDFQKDYLLCFQAKGLKEDLCNEGNESDRLLSFSFLFS
jgi:hypothetical protein